MSDEKALKILIVGSVSGGISAAVRARRLSEIASIIVIERHSYISYANTGVPSALGGLIEGDTLLASQTPAALKARFNIDVRLRSELITISQDDHSITIRDLDTGSTYQLPYDKLILAQGAESVFPLTEGSNSPNVFTLQTLPDLQTIRDYIKENECRHAAVIGAGFNCLKPAENLKNFGLHVSVLASENRLIPHYDPDMAELIHTELRHKNIDLRLNCKVMKIGGVEKRIVLLADGSNIPADIVVVAAALRPRTSEVKEAGLAIGKVGVSVNPFMQTSDVDIYAVGDMVETEHQIAHSPQLMANEGGGLAARQGRLAADHIFGKATPYRGNVTTFVTTIFNLTAGITGLSATSLRQLSYSPLWATIHTPDHAGYYPSSKQTTLRIAFEPSTGRLLGAQAVGRSGIHKRIDVLSTALQAGMSVFDLEHLEQSYAPQYGPARDPVNIAGSVCGNILRGDLDLVHPEELLDLPHDHQVIDVRPTEEFIKRHVKRARNIPLDGFRDHLASVDKQRPVVVYSRVGYHGYISYRILKQLGYKVANLDGGFKLLLEGGFQSLLTSES